LQKNQNKTTQKMIQVIITDDHRLFRMGIKTAVLAHHPDISIMGEADSGEALFALPALSTAHLVLLDIHLPGMSGVEVARRLRRDYPAIKILAVSSENSAKTVEEMIEAGIDGFISKQYGDPDELAQAIRLVADGLEYFGRDISSVIYNIYVSKKGTTQVTTEFTSRERDILLLCRDGLQSKEIAARLKISTNTVHKHKERIFQKLGINSTIEMVQYALKKGIIKVEN
jgi:two-component system response regulator NreC